MSRDNEPVDTTDLEELIAEATEAGVQDDYDAMLTYARQSRHNLARAINTLQDRIIEETKGGAVNSDLGDPIEEGTTNMEAVLDAMRDDWRDSVYVIADINPEPWTSPDVAVGRKGGKAFPMVYSSAALKAYKQAIREDLGDAHTPTEDDVALIFYFWRQLPAYETERARKARKHEADATNLQKALEDALQGVLFKNDRQVVGVSSWVMEQAHGTRPLIIIEMFRDPQRPDLSPGQQARVAEHVEAHKVVAPKRRNVNVREIF